MVSSTSSSRSASPDCAETMQIFVKNVSGETIALTVPQDLTVANLTTLLSVRTSLPSPDLRLVYAGKHLSPSSTLADHRIARESTLHLALPMRGGMPPKKLRCTFKDCREGAQRIIGDCGFCNGHFCGKHRLLEDHKCDGLEDCKKESHDRNAAQLNKERTQVIKGI
ncbi:Ubiquitin-like protein [Glarea lozoyensis ATCC 20868]|uniref:Ubiquitin-like protein n=2 Tax=Glarea lozoyensis TaxID=101852 RepID=S3CXS5_GLAL2|nr:Ubiquitin-like protein [Glarea lozoyensis ATCC 20868]EHK98318.1 putative Polyubiquitin [Glarea lozoyensis 74030]EPE30395.1 Ubiquitin-like protein [Glarea lozoyensis ATCC 20868]